MLVLPTSLVAIASSLAISDPSTAGTIAMISTAADFAASTDILANNILSATAVTTTTTTTASASDYFQSMLSSTSQVLSLLDSGTPQEILGSSINNPDNDVWGFLSATFSRVSETFASAKNSDFEFEPIFDNPFAVLSTMALVTASDMVPFVPCQPLAISLGAKYGAYAFPVCVVGQTLAGVLAFQSSRKVSDAEQVQTVLESLGENGKLRFQKFRTESLLGGSKDNVDGDIDIDSDIDGGATDERTVFFAMVGLRLAPFFPFSAGNYLLGGATDVGLRPFVLATILGCMLSNAVSVLVGMGGAELLMNTANN
jgi:hypothetical protein